VKQADGLGSPSYETMWNLPPPPDFQGLRDDLPVEVYVRHLPHWRQEGATYFVTFRLEDSLPQAKLKELDGLRREWMQRYPARQSRHALEELARLTSQRVESWLDQGMGSCLLRRLELAAHVIGAMHHFDGQRYELGAYVVMPNHVHAILRPTQCRTKPLEVVLKSWKQFSSHRIHEQVGGSGSLWQEESYDRIIRDCEHLDRCLQYIAANPRKAGLPSEACPRWIRPQWARLGWNFRE
jgi:putative transposase